MDFHKSDGFTCAGDIPYGYIHFEQNFLYYRILPVFVTSMSQVTHHQLKTHLKQSDAPKSNLI